MGAPIATTAASRMATASTSTGRSANTWASATESTSASAPPWPVSRGGSPSTRCSGASRSGRSTGTTPRWPARRPYVAGSPCPCERLKSGRMSGVVVVIGTGGMGMAMARRCGSGARVLLADVEDKALDVAASELRNEGYDVETLRTDVSDEGEVAALAATAAALGSVRSLVHTAGVSPVQAPADRVVAVDLVGTAYVLEAFAGVVAEGGAGVVISSMAGHLAGPLSAEEEAALTNAV